MKISLHKRFVVLLAASLLAGSCLAADDTGDPNGGKPSDKNNKQMSSSSVKSSESPIPRVWIGLTGSYTPLKLLKTTGNNGYSDNLGDTFTDTTAQGQFGGGATINARVYRGFWLSVGAIYRFTGYDWTEDTTNNATGVITPIGTVVNNIYIERSRLRLIDFPVMVRYTGRKYNISKYTFYEAGGVLRDGLSHTVIDNVTNVSGYTPGPTVSSGTNYRRLVPGAMVGAGITAKDDFGIIVSPEVRYTRWMGDSLSSNILGTQRNQLEITVSFGF